MSDTPNELKYTNTHEWIRTEDDGTVTVGITDHAQGLLGDIVYVELPDLGEIKAGDECTVLESVKAAADVYAPITGNIIAVNDELSDAPALINSDPYGDGWIFRMEPKDAQEIAELLDADNYSEQVASEEH